MRSLVLALLAGLVGAVMLHIVIILAIPHFSDRDAWARVSALGEPGVFHMLSDTAGDGLSADDPFVRSAVCRFHITDAPIRLTSKGAPDFWSLAVFDRQANEVYSMNDRTAVERRVDVTLAMPAQMADLRRNRPAALEKSILVDLSDPDGYVVLRTIAEDATWEPIARAFLAEAECDPAGVAVKTG